MQLYDKSLDCIALEKKEKVIAISTSDCKIKLFELVSFSQILGLNEVFKL